MKKVLAIANQYPGETFIQAHVKTMRDLAPEIDLKIAYTQTNRIGVLPSWAQNVNCYAWPNYNLLPSWHQVLLSLQYPLSSLKKLHQPQRNFIKSIEPNHLHFHFSGLAVKYAFLCEELNIPFSLSIRGTDMHHLKTIASSHFTNQFKETLNQASAIHCVSDELNNTLQQKFNYHKALTIRTVLSNKWTLVKRNPKPNQFVAVGRLTWQKGYTDLITAAHYLKQKGYTFTIQIIGEGNQRSELEWMITKLNLLDTIVLVGECTQEEIQSYLSQAQCFILSSIAEGFPNVVLEAMLSKVPVITSNCSDLATCFTDEIDCAFYQAGSSEKLANRMEQIINGTISLHLESAAQKASNLSSKHQHVKLYKELWQC